jgi:hypothetical protein
MVAGQLYVIQAAKRKASRRHKTSQEVRKSITDANSHHFGEQMDGWQFRRFKLDVNQTSSFQTVGLDSCPPQLSVVGPELLALTMGDEGDDLAAAASKDPAVTPGEDANQPPGDEEVQAIDFYISYRCKPFSAMSLLSASSLMAFATWMHSTRPVQECPLAGNASNLSLMIISSGSLG